MLEASITHSDMKLHDDALTHGDRHGVEAFWNTVADNVGCEVSDLTDVVLDDYNSGLLKKSSMCYYMSSLSMLRSDDNNGI